MVVSKRLQMYVMTVILQFDRPIITRCYIGCRWHILCLCGSKNTGKKFRTRCGQSFFNICLTHTHTHTCNAPMLVDFVPKFELTIQNILISPHERHLITYKDPNACQPFVKALNHFLCAAIVCCFYCFFMSLENSYDHPWGPYAIVFIIRITELSFWRCRCCYCHYHGYLVCVENNGKKIRKPFSHLVVVAVVLVFSCFLLMHTYLVCRTCLLSFARTSQFSHTIVYHFSFVLFLLFSSLLLIPLPFPH